MFNPKVSIIILNWNSLTDTSECLESIKKNNYSNYDVIVVDNGSIDGSAEKIEKLFPKVTLIRNKRNIGYAGGNNVGIRQGLHGGSKYVWLLNNDAIISSDVLSKLVNTAESAANIGLVSPIIYDYFVPSKIQFCGAYLDWRTFSITSILGPEDRVKMKGKDVVLWGTALLIKRDLVDTIGDLNEKYFAYFEDSEYSLRSLKAGFVNMVEFSSGVFHKCHGAETDKKNQSTYMFYMTRNRYLFWNNNISIFRKPFHFLMYISNILEDVGYYRDSAKHDLIDASIDGLYCAFRNHGGSRALSRHAPALLKRFILSHPFLYAYILSGNLKKIVSGITKLKSHSLKPVNVER